ncbi:TetR/AcrR family transcriptional regulator [Sandaracinobacteroides sp. A072]|uniref:TetR/AcrR family transcriptional regulator n=1 Tax=Sandaracinobacteroides sp. A072 TaxID=3461146 RepID=UPI004041A342
MAVAPDEILPQTETKLDGRRERSADSRRRIIAAMMELVESGLYAPTAEAVAARAEVSLRTVFRHFEEMDNLYMEIVEILFERVAPMLDQPMVARTWPALLDETLDQRAMLFEAIAPYFVTMTLHRHRNKTMASQGRRLVTMSRDLLAVTLPAQLVSDRQLFELMCALLSMETWLRLRETQGLTVAEAKAALRRAAVALWPVEG